MSVKKLLGALLLTASAAGCSCGTEDRLDLTAHLECRGCTLDGDGVVLVDFGTVVLGGSAGRTLELGNKGSAPLRVVMPRFAAEFTSSPGDFSIAPGTTQVVQLAYAPSAEREDVSEGRVAAEGARGLDVRLRGKGSVIAVECEPGEVSFGAVIVETDRTRPVRCRNVKPDLVARVNVGLEGDPEFENRGDGVLEIPPGETAEVPIRFAPTEAGRRSARLLVTTDARDHLDAVAMDGQGIDSGLRIEPAPGDDGCYDLGFVAPGGSVQLPLRALNVGNLAVQVSGIEVDPAEAPFRVEPAGPFTVSSADDAGVPGEQLLQVTFEPGALGPAQATLHVISDDRNNERIDLCVKGYGGGPVLQCVPQVLGFGLTDINTPRTRPVFCTNVGTEVPGEPDSWMSVAGVMAAAPFSATVAEASSRTYAPGDTFRVDVTFAPDGERGYNDQLLVRTSGGEAAIPLSGEGRLFEACTFELRPPDGLDYGVVNRGRSLELSQVFVNRGATECLLTDVGVSGAQARYFALGAGYEEPRVVAPGESVRIPVTFTGGLPGDYHGNLDMTVNGPGTLALPLDAKVVDLCFELSVSEADFGTVEPGCSSPRRYLQIINACREPMLVTRVDIPHIETDEFKLLEAPPTPFHVPGGAVAEVLVAYQPITEGEDVGQLRVHADTLPGPVIGLLHGKGGPVEDQTDHFEGIGRSSADILWVIDNSGSMGQEQEGIARNAGPFIDVALDRKIDFRMGVTSTDMDGGLKGRLYPLDQKHPRILTNRGLREDLEKDWEYLIKQGTSGSGNEKGLAAARAALSPPLISSLDLPETPEKYDGNLGFLRRDANLTIIIVSDERDSSYEVAPSSTYWEEYVSFFRNIKGERRSDSMLRVHTITGGLEGCATAGVATGYNEVAEATGGIIQSICASDWSEALQEIADSALSFESCFTLHGLPGPQPGETSTDPEDWLQVMFDGKPQPRRSPSGNVVWRYDAETNEICFDPYYAPRPSDYVDVTYRVACGL